MSASRTRYRFTSLVVVVVVASLAMACTGIALGQGATKVTFHRWVVVLQHHDERSVSLGKTFEHCASEPVTTIAAYGRVKNSKQGISTVERWFRNGKLFHAFHLQWSSNGSGSYSSYGLGTDDEKGFKDGTWKVEKSQHGHRIGKATIKLVSDTSC